MSVRGTNATFGNVRFSAGYEGEAGICWRLPSDTNYENAF
jgi:hypothetical protein